MLIPLITATGWTLARTPEPLLNALSGLLGAIMSVTPRDRLVRDNLELCFPERPASWRARMARQSHRCLMETTLLALASPYLSAERMRRMDTSTSKRGGARPRGARARHPSQILNPKRHVNTKH